MADLYVTKVGLQVLSQYPEIARVTKIGMQVLSSQSEELHLTKIGMQVLSSVEEFPGDNPRRSVVVIGG